MDATAPLSIQSYSIDGTIVVSVMGELDLATRDRLRAALEWIEANGEESIAVDLAGLSFVDAGGLHALIEARDSARMRGATLEFRNPTTAFRRLVALVGLDDLIEEARDGA